MTDHEHVPLDDDALNAATGIFNGLMLSLFLFWLPVLLWIVW